MNSLSSKSNLQPAHLDDVYHTPPSLRVTTSKNKNKSRMKKKKKKNKSLLHPNKVTYLVRKFQQLIKVFTPIPFKPLDLSSLSTAQENLLKRAGLWGFLNLKFDPELRSDLIAELIVSYDPQAAAYRRCFVNGRPLKLTRPEMGRALALPWRRKAEKENFCGSEPISDEEVLFLESVVLKSVVLCGGEDGLGDDVLEVIRFMKEERRPERVDWTGLLWTMVEKELGKGAELKGCYYASHLQWFLRTQKYNFFAKEVEKSGFDDLGVQKLDLGILGIDEKESEKKMKGYQRRKSKNVKRVCSEGQVQESDKKSGLGLGRVKGGKVVELDVSIFDDNQLGVSTFGHAEVTSEFNFAENPNESVVGDSREVGGDLVGGKSGEEVINVGLTGLEKGKDELIMMQEGKGNELDGRCLMNGAEDGRVEVGSGRFGLLTEKGKEDDCKVVPLFEGECMVNLKMRGSDEDGLILMQDGKGNQLEGECLMKGGDDGEVEVGSESVGLITKVGKENDCKWKMWGSDDAYAMEIGNEESESLVLNSEQDNVADVKISEAGLIIEHGKNDVVDGKSGGVNGDTGGKCDDQPSIVLENDKDGLSSIADGNVCLLEGECLLKESEDRGEKERNDNVFSITGEGKEGDSKVDFSVKGGDTEMGGYDDISAMEGKEKSVLMVQHDEEDNVVDVYIEGSYDDGVKQMEKELPEHFTEHGKDDQLKLDILVDGEGLVSVDTSCSGEFKEKQLDREPICLTRDESDNMDQEIGKGNDVHMVMVSEKEVGDTKVGLCLLQGEVKREGEDIMMSSCDDDSGKQMEIRQMKSISLERGNSVLEDQEKSMHLRQGEKTEVMVEAKQELLQHYSPSMDAAYEFQSEKAVEIREEDNADNKDMEDQDTDTGSASVLEKVVEISEEDSPCAIVNDCSVLSGVSMMDSYFCGNASKNDVFVEPFVLEHNVNANMSRSAVFGNPLKTELDLLNDGQKGSTTEGVSEKMPITPLKRKMNHTNDGHGRMASEGQLNKDLGDLSSWGEQIDFWLAQAKMVGAEREDAWLSAQLEEQRLSKKLKQLDNTIHLIEKTKHEELRKRISKINCLENELFFMGNQVEHYKKALETIYKTFAAFREQYKVHEEPLYMDIPGSGGVVLSSTEWEKERLRREEEERNNHLDRMITTFQLHWINQFEGHKTRIKTFSDRLSNGENNVKHLRNMFQSTMLGE